MFGPEHEALAGLRFCTRAVLGTTHHSTLLVPPRMSVSGDASQLIGTREARHTCDRGWRRVKIQSMACCIASVTALATPKPKLSIDRIVS